MLFSSIYEFTRKPRSFTIEVIDLTIVRDGTPAVFEILASLLRNDKISNEVTKNNQEF